jgi:hypothetical protein
MQDYLNPNITSETLCDNYQFTTDYNDCVSSRDESFNELVNITLISFDFIDGYFYAKIRAEYTEADDEIGENKILYQKDNEGNLSFTFVEPDIEDEQQYIDLLESFFFELNNSSYGPEVCDYYYNEAALDSCDYLVHHKTENNMQYYINDLHIYDGFAQLVVEAVNENETKEMNITVFFYVDQYDNIRISMDIDDGTYISQELRDIISDYIEKYNQSYLDDADFCTTYVPSEDYDKCMTERSKMHQQDYHAYYQDLYINEVGEMILIVRFSNNDNQMKIEYKVELVLEDNTFKLKLTPNIVEQEITLEMITVYAQDFVHEFNNLLLDTADFLTYYVGPDSTQLIEGIREHAILNNLQIMQYAITETEPGKYEFDFTMTDNTTYTFHIIMIEPPRIAELYQINMDTVTLNDVEELMNSFINAIHQQDYIENICNDFVNPLQYDSCLRLVTDVLYNGTHIEIHSIEKVNDYFRVTLLYTRIDGNAEIKIIDINVYEDGNTLLFGFMNEPLDVAYDEKVNFMWNFTTEFSDFNNLDHDYVCSYLSTNSYDECMQRRQALLPNNTKMNPYNYDFYTYPNYIDFAIYTPDGANIISMVSYEVDFYYNEQGEVVMNIRHIDEFAYYIPDNDGVTFIETMIQAFNDNQLSSEAFCQTYPMFYDCVSFRNDLQLHGETLGLLEVMPYMDHRFYAANIEIIGSDGYMITVIPWLFSITKDLNDDMLYLEGYLLEEYKRDYNLTDLQTQITQFIDDYFTTSISNEMLIGTYGFDNFMSGLYNRSYIINNYTYQLGVVVPSTLPGTYIIPMYLSTGNTTLEQEIVFQIITFDNQNYIVQIHHEPWDFVDFNLTEFTDDFVDDILDITLSDDAFCFTYFGESEYEYCLSLRTELNDNYWSVAIDSMDQTEHTASFSIGIYNEWNELQAIEEFELLYEIDIFGNHHPILLPHQEQNEQVIAATTMMNFLVDSLNNETLTISSFCSFYVTCPDLFNDQLVNEVVLENILFDPDTSSLSTELTFFLADGTIEHHIYDIIYAENNGQETVSIVFRGYHEEQPYMGIFLDLEEATAVLQMYFNDLLNPDITDQTICETYFTGDNDVDPNCLTDCQGMLDNALSITMDPLLLEEVNGEQFYLLVYDIEYETYTDQFTTYVVVWKLPDIAQYQIQFIDYIS